ncbi:3677_t:CDS:2 [Ambispora gerdemannii]|uniref:Uridylate kinase n=1 Tax=Ambispora gerdemannii TaxID=144530 RepID=A0A9N9APM2_9GLOM|nr:3677_t:CDS:2 [Ambispora gerdemannii]
MDNKELKNEDSTKPKKLSKNDVMVVFVLGGPGSGKGTQSEKLVKDFGFIHLSAGDLLRAEQQRPDSLYSELIAKTIRDGEIVPSELTIALLEQSMRESGGKRFLIDGFPRKMDQAIKFEEDVIEAHSVLFFDCSEEVMLERLLERGKTSGRADDNIETIQKRFISFKQQSYPVIEYYQKLGKVHSISCEDLPDIVYQKVKNIYNEVFDENQ